MDSRFGDTQTSYQSVNVFGREGIAGNGIAEITKSSCYSAAHNGILPQIGI